MLAARHGLDGSGEVRYLYGVRARIRGNKATSLDCFSKADELLLRRQITNAFAELRKKTSEKGFT